MRRLLALTVLFLVGCTARPVLPGFYQRPAAHPQCPQGPNFLAGVGSSTVSPEEAEALARASLAAAYRSELSGVYERKYSVEQRSGTVVEQSEERSTLSQRFNFEHAELFAILSRHHDQVTGHYHAFACLDRNKAAELLVAKTQALDGALRLTTMQAEQALAERRFDLFAQALTTIRAELLRRADLDLQHRTLVGTPLPPPTDCSNLEAVASSWLMEAAVTIALTGDAAVLRTARAALERTLGATSLRFGFAESCPQPSPYTLLLELQVDVGASANVPSSWRTTTLVLGGTVKRCENAAVVTEFPRTTLSGVAASDLADPDTRLIETAPEVLRPALQVLARHVPLQLREVSPP
ncbi:MAG: hypothetical protein A2284_13255 [Deltaproteobacteria bacterium RIFOXYA12_FULL_61_11]|nr:MAG: hypothetical protein A2284_13255 [Deltaproteobacteria bacterium RIFOXYA12_FULL_61_11]